MVRLFLQLRSPKHLLLFQPPCFPLRSSVSYFPPSVNCSLAWSLLFPSPLRGPSPPLILLLSDSDVTKLEDPNPHASTDYLAVEEVYLLIAPNGSMTVVLQFPMWFDGRTFLFDSSKPIFHDGTKRWSVAIAFGLRGYVYAPMPSRVYFYLSSDFAAAVSAALGKPCFDFGDAPAPVTFCHCPFGLVRTLASQPVPMINTTVPITNVRVSKLHPCLCIQ